MMGCLAVMAGFEVKRVRALPITPERVKAARAA